MAREQDLLREVADLKRSKRAVEVERDQMKNVLESLLKDTNCSTVTELTAKFDSLQRAYAEQREIILGSPEPTPQTEP